MLEIFPQSLAYSIIASVYVGFLFSFLLNETFGWPASGLVVPGYLAPVFVIAPVSGFLVVLEGILAYLLVLALSEGFSRLGLWSRFFGRDRFFAILLSSVLVRALLEGVLIHRYGGLLSEHLGISFEALGQFYGIGFVCSALLANALWKPGLRRGLGGLGFLIGATYLAVRWVLIPLSNFSVVRLDLIYEDLAINFLASPRAYIFLLVGAALSSRLSRLFGFATGGILVAPLLALTVSAPLKLLLTVVEAVLVVYLARWVLGLRFLAGRSVEGARRLLLAFSLAFALRLLEGWILDLVHVPVSGTELTAFGYMITSLLAVQIMQRDSVGLVIRPVLQNVLATFVLGTLICLGVPRARSWLEVAPPPPTDRIQVESSDWDATLLRLQEPHLIRPTGIDPPALPDDLARFRDSIEILLGWRGEDVPGALNRSLEQLSHLGYRLEEIRDPGQRRRLVLTPDATVPQRRLWGSYVLAPESPSSLSMEVLRPEEPLTLEAALNLHRRLSSRVLAVAPPRRSVDRSMRWDSRSTPSPLAIVLESAGVNLRVQVRATEQGGSSIEGPGPAVQPLDGLRDRELELRLGLLSSAEPDRPVRVRLRLDRADREGLLEDPPPLIARSEQLMRSLEGWAREAMESPVRPVMSELELRYLRQHLLPTLDPLIRGEPDALEGVSQRELAHHVRILGWRFSRARGFGGREGLLFLPDGRGTALFLALGPGHRILMEVPDLERAPELLTFCGDLAARLEPRALLLRVSPTRELLPEEPTRTELQLLHQTLAMGMGRAGLTLQLRTSPFLQDEQTRVVYTWGLRQDLEPAREVLDALQVLGLTAQESTASASSAGLTGTSAQKELNRFTGLPYAALYFPPDLRAIVRDDLGDRIQELGAERLGLSMERGDLRDFLDSGTAGRGRSDWPTAWIDLREPVESFLASGNPWSLRRIGERSRALGLEAGLLRDIDARATFLIASPMESRGAAPALVIRLGAAGRTAIPPRPAESLGSFLTRRASLLLLSGGAS